MDHFAQLRAEILRTFEKIISAFEGPIDPYMVFKMIAMAMLVGTRDIFEAIKR